MKQLKVLNILFASIACITTWLTDANTNDKIFISIFCAVVILFWLLASNNRLGNNYKIIG
jgi:hypothetical protein